MNEVKMKHFFVVLLLLFAADLGFNAYQWQKVDEIDKSVKIPCVGDNYEEDMIGCMERQYGSERADMKGAENAMTKIQKIAVTKYLVLTILISLLVFITFFNSFFQNALKGKYKFMVIISHLFFLYFFLHSIYEWTHFSSWDEIYNAKDEGLEDLKGLFQYGTLLFIGDQIKLVIKNSIILQIGVILYFRLYFKIRKVGKETSFEEGNYQEIES